MCKPISITIPHNTSLLQCWSCGIGNCIGDSKEEISEAQFITSSSRQYANRSLLKQTLVKENKLNSACRPFKGLLHANSCNSQNNFFQEKKKSLILTYSLVMSYMNTMHLDHLHLLLSSFSWTYPLSSNFIPPPPITH